MALRRFIGVALLAWLMGQWTVLAHAIEHAQGVPGVESPAEGDAAWGHAAGAAACHIVDHLLTGQAPAAEPPTPPCGPIADRRLAVPAPASRLPDAAPSAYEARGPPRA